MARDRSRHGAPARHKPRGGADLGERSSPPLHVGRGASRSGGGTVAGEGRRHGAQRRPEDGPTRKSLAAVAHDLDSLATYLAMVAHVAEEIEVDEDERRLCRTAQT